MKVGRIIPPIFKKVGKKRVSAFWIYSIPADVDNLHPSIPSTSNNVLFTTFSIVCYKSHIKKENMIYTLYINLNISRTNLWDELGSNVIINNSSYH